MKNGIETKGKKNLFRPSTKEEGGIILLLDPDKKELFESDKFYEFLKELEPELILVGGSLVSRGEVSTWVDSIKEKSKSPVYLFPGNSSQILPNYDGVLFMTLLSGRNPEYLIGQQVHSAPLIHHYDLDTVSLAYLLVDGGKPTSVSYISNTQPIPADKNDIAVSTALAAKYLGMSSVYLEAGSGAEKPVPLAMIRAVKEKVGLPLIVGGGLRDLGQIEGAFHAGANYVVIGTKIEDDFSFMKELIKYKKEKNGAEKKQTV